MNTSMRFHLIFVTMLACSAGNVPICTQEVATARDRTRSVETAGEPANATSRKLEHQRLLPSNVLSVDFVIASAQRDQENQAEQKENGKDNAQKPTSPNLGDVCSRVVSLEAKAMPLRDALVAVARAAKVELVIEEIALKQAHVDLDEPVTVAFDEVPLGEALIQLLRFDPLNGVMRTLRNGKLILTTVTALIQHERETTLRVLPEWLKPFYGNRLSVILDDDNQIVAITASDATDELLSRLKLLPNLRELKISSTTKLTAAGLAQLANLTGLEKLALSTLSTSGDELADVAIQHIVGLKSLRELRLHECGTTDVGIKLLERMPQLTQLDIYQEGKLTDAALSSIATLTGLKRLSLTSYVGTQRLGFMRFSPEALRQLTALQDLNVLTLPGQIAPDILLAFPKLKSLDLSGPLVDDAVAEKIAGHRALGSLSLSGTRITDQGWKMIATLPDLRQLSLRRERITDNGIAHLKGLTKLDHLELRTSRLTDAALGHLAEIKSLTRLDLWGDGSAFGGGGSNFTVMGLQQLKRLPKLRTLWLINLEDQAGYIGLKELTQLRELVFEMGGITQPQFNELEIALPKTRISAGTGGGFMRSIRSP